MAIQNTLVTTIASNVYVSSGNSAITAVYLCNYGASATSFNVWACPAGNLATTTTQIYYNVTVQSGDTYVIDNEKMILSNGDMIKANATANTSITTTVSYIGI